MRGRYAIVTERWRGLRWMLWRQVLAPGENVSRRTAKSCGPGAATLASSRVVSPMPATVAKQAAHRGEHEVSRKAIARGKSGCLGCTCQTRVRSFYHCTRWLAGAVGARLSLRPLFGG